MHSRSEELITHLLALAVCLWAAASRALAAAPTPASDEIAVELVCLHAGNTSTQPDLAALLSQVHPDAAQIRSLDSASRDPRRTPAQRCAALVMLGDAAHPGRAQGLLRAFGRIQAGIAPHHVWTFWHYLSLLSSRLEGGLPGIRSEPGPGGHTSGQTGGAVSVMQPPTARERITPTTAASPPDGVHRPLYYGGWPARLTWHGLLAPIMAAIADVRAR